MDNKFFSLIHQKIKKIPFIGESVSHVDLRRNEITKMDFTYNTNIEYLDLSDNNIKIMENLNKLPNLRILDLSYNLLNKINLPSLNLKELYLICNDIEKIENLNLKKIIKLDLAVNNIVIIENLSNCPTLRELYLGSNRIRETGDLKYLKSLRALDLQNNQLSKIDCNDLPDSLESLLLSDNKDLVELKNLERLTNLKLLAIERTKVKNVKSCNNLEVWK